MDTDLNGLTQLALERCESIPGLIYMAYRGSIAHGMYTPTIGGIELDDVDLMGVVVPPADHYHGLKEFGSRGTVEIDDPPWDIVIYEARKMLRLLRGCNPNVIACLFVREEHVLSRAEGGRLLRENRRMFISRDLYKPYVGYAMGQLKRMRKMDRVGKRKELVDRFGYDTKHAAHLIRLLRMAVEALETGEVNIYRENDADMLLSIKRGEWLLERIEEDAELLFGACERARDESSIPEHVDREAVNRLCVDVVESVMGNR